MELSEIDELLAEAETRKSVVTVKQLDVTILALRQALANAHVIAKEKGEAVGQCVVEHEKIMNKLVKLKELAEFITKEKLDFAERDLARLSELQKKELNRRSDDLTKVEAEIAEQELELAKAIEERAKFPATMPTVAPLPAKRLPKDGEDDEEALIELAAPLAKRMADQRVVICGGVPGRASNQRLATFLGKALKPRRIDWPEISEEKLMNVARNSSVDVMVMFAKLMPAGNLRAIALKHGIRVAISDGMGKYATLEAIALAYGVDLGVNG